MRTGRIKKVLFLTTISGFLQQFEMNDVNILQEMGYEVHYASNFYNPVYEVNKTELRKKGIVLHQVGIQKSPVRLKANLKALFTVRTLIKKEKIDVVHCHNPMGGVIGRFATFGIHRRVIVIYTAHGFHFYKGAPLRNWLLYFTAERLLAGRTDRLITINKEDYARACKFHLRRGGQVERIPGVGVNTAKFAPVVGRREEVRRELGIPEDAFYVLSVGELNDNKNHKVIMQAIANIHNPNIYYGICGRGPMEAELKDIADELGIAEQVRLYGFRNDIPRMLSAADCFAFPSKREGLGIAAIEALAAGIPLITSDCRGTREYMKHGVNGYVCKRGTADEYAVAICNMREQIEKRKEMSEECLKTAEKFDISATDKIMRKLYKSLPL